jgi:beta-glucuronidase
VREDWLNLNGRWGFEIDRGDSGLERGLVDRELAGSILVPFAPESVASGIGDTDFLEAVWYRRTVTIPDTWAGKRVLLHVGACDHDATVWVNGTEVARHRGGFTSFTADLGDTVTAGGHAVIVIRARDSRHGVQARGKQATFFANSGCHYTRTTGIWQTVWLEAVPEVSIRALRIVPNLGTASFTVTTTLSANRAGYLVRLEISDGDDPAAADTVIVTGVVPADRDLAPQATLTIPADRRRPWSPQDPHLYGLQATLLDADGRPADTVRSYAGLRSVAIDGNRLLLNGEPVFQRLVLDQGFWPDTLMTAPSDGALVRDIELARAAGFNGARLHQKVFEERYLYHADRLGFLVWGEFGDWGASGQGPTGDNQRPTASFVTQWLEALQRDINHPSIVGWCPLNETHQLMHDRTTVLDDVTRAMFLATKLADPTRPVIDASGYSHRVPETDVYDSHSYEQDPARFAAQQAGLATGHPYANRHPEGDYSVAYRGQPYFVSEFGGIWWATPSGTGASAGGDGNSGPVPDPGGDSRTVAGPAPGPGGGSHTGTDPDVGSTDSGGTDGWGYGARVADEEEFYARLAGLVAVLRDDPGMFGYCYTQLTDVFQECNGIYRFDRSSKLDVDRIRAIQQQPAAYERR